MTKSVKISSTGLRNVVLSRFTEDDDITMIFGEQEIKMNRIFAEFISPFISHHHQSDPTITSFNFNDLFSSNADKFNLFSKDVFTTDIISLFQLISSGYSIEIDDRQAFKFRFLSIILENEELFTKINELFPPDFSKENLELYVDYIQCCYNFSIISNDFDFSSLINYISSNFYSLPEEKFLKLPLEMQYSIISNPHLQIASEDSLLDTVMQIINGIDDNSLKSQDEIEKVLFLEHIEFTSLSEEKLREFLSVFDFNSITSSLWKKFYECFFIHFDKKPERFVNRMSEKLTFEYIENQTGKLEGIIHYLSEKFGGNVVDKGICKVTSSSVFKNFYPKNVIDFNKLCLFTSDSTIDTVDPWLKIDFLGRKIHPTHYTIRTVGNKRNGCHLKNWVFECSNTDKNDDWIILDSRNNVDSLNNSLAIETFDIKENIDDNEYFRYFRIRQTGLNCSNTNQLAFCSLELFGTII